MTRHNGLLPAPTCYGLLATGKLYGEIGVMDYGLFWPLLRSHRRRDMKTFAPTRTRWVGLAMLFLLVRGMGSHVPDPILVSSCATYLSQCLLEILMICMPQGTLRCLQVEYHRAGLRSHFVTVCNWVIFALQYRFTNSLRTVVTACLLLTTVRKQYTRVGYVFCPIYLCCFTRNKLVDWLIDWLIYPNTQLLRLSMQVKKQYYDRAPGVLIDNSRRWRRYNVWRLW